MPKNQRQLPAVRTDIGGEHRRACAQGIRVLQRGRALGNAGIRRIAVASARKIDAAADQPDMESIASLRTSVPPSPRCQRAKAMRGPTTEPRPVQFTFRKDWRGLHRTPPSVSRRRPAGRKQRLRRRCRFGKAANRLRDLRAAQIDQRARLAHRDLSERDLQRFIGGGTLHEPNHGTRSQMERVDDVYYDRAATTGLDAGGHAAEYAILDANPARRKRGISVACIGQPPLNGRTQLRTADRRLKRAANEAVFEAGEANECRFDRIAVAALVAAVSSGTKSIFSNVIRSAGTSSLRGNTARGASAPWADDLVRLQRSALAGIAQSQGSQSTFFEPMGSL